LIFDLFGKCLVLRNATQLCNEYIYDWKEDKFTLRYSTFPNYCATEITSKEPEATILILVLCTMCTGRISYRINRCWNLEYPLSPFCTNSADCRTRRRKY